MSEKQYMYADENGNIFVVNEKDLPRCPRNGGISPNVIIIGEAKAKPKIEHVNCRCVPFPLMEEKEDDPTEDD